MSRITTSVKIESGLVVKDERIKRWRWLKDVGSFLGQRNVLTSITVMITQLCEYTNKHWIVHLRWVDLCYKSIIEVAFFYKLCDMEKKNKENGGCTILSNGGWAYSYPVSALQETNQWYNTYGINQGQCEHYQHYFLCASIWDKSVCKILN